VEDLITEAMESAVADWHDENETSKVGMKEIMMKGSERNNELVAWEVFFSSCWSDS
jgi:hypothetical protein